MITMYDIERLHSELTTWLDSGELTEEQEAQAQDYLDRLLDRLLPEKVEAYCKIIRTIESEAAAHAAEAKRITDRKRTLDNKTQALKSRLESALVFTGQRKVKAGTFTVAMQANPPSVVVDDIEALPADLKVVTVEANKGAIKERIRAGEEIPGARLEQREGLRIR